jgi:hypothetical protein
LSPPGNFAGSVKVNNNTSIPKSAGFCSEHLPQSKKGFTKFTGGSWKKRIFDAGNISTIIKHDQYSAPVRPAIFSHYKNITHEKAATGRTELKRAAKPAKE